MKKFLLILLALAVMGLPMIATATEAVEAGCATKCHGDPCGAEPDVYGLFLTTTDKDISDCGMVCPGDRVGMIDWKGEGVKIVDMTTGEGFCKKPGPCLNWLLCQCEAADEIKVNGKYGITVEILTEGVSFESVASTEPPIISMTEYEDKEALCEGEEGYTKELLYHFTDGTHTVIVTNGYRRLFTRNSLYISICDLPRLVIDERIVEYGTPVILRLGLYDASIVCQPSCSRLCECTKTIAVMACFDECCAVLPYLPLSGGYWSGVAISNLSAHSGSCIAVFSNGTDRVTKHYTVPAYGIKTVNVGDVIDGPAAMCVIKSSFSMRAVSFGGTDSSAFALPATGCGGCGGCR